MLTNPDIVAALRVQLTMLVVAVLLFIATIDDDPEPPNAGAPIAEVAPYTPWPITEQQYEMFEMPFAGQREEDYFPRDPFQDELKRQARRDTWSGLCD